MTSVDDQARETAAARVLAGGGELGALMRALDWSTTSLGPVEGWPRALKTCVRLMLTSRQPMWLGWGDELIFLYNDPYRSIVGGKHPWALGKPTSVVWHEIWTDIAPRIESALRGDEGTYDEALLLIMERHGYPEETYYTFSYSPIPDDDGRVAGIFCANTDDTRRVIGERQLVLLRELAAGTAEARTVADACTLSMRSLDTNPWDVPFAAIYLLDPEQRRAVLAGTSNIAPGHPTAPEAIALDDASGWPIAEVVDAKAPRLISDLDALFGPVPSGAWDRPPAQAVALSIAPSGQSGQAGVLIVGLNPYRLFDDDYQGFLGLVAGQIGAAIAAAQAYQDERMRAEALDRAKTAFFSNVSHEFRTPLTLLLGPLEEALAVPPDVSVETLRPALESAHRNSLRLLRLVNTLLDFSRIEAGRAEASYEPTDLAAHTAELAGVFRSAVERAGLRLTVDCAPLPEPVYVDHEMWEKIVLNLLSNALKFTFTGEIAVTLRAAGDAVTLDVRDTGSGIPAEEIPHLFERFHRVRGARARTHEGTGIGLALVRELVTLHGGTIGVESVVDGGTTFTVALPLGTAHLPAERIGAARALASTALGAAPYVEEALRWLPDAGAIETPAQLPVGDAAPSEAGGPAAAAPAARVLLADDNADMRAYVRRLLGTRYAVEAVANGTEALAAARAHLPDLVLTDIMMPGLDGFALLRELRADPCTATLPVILLSARAGEEATAAGLAAGADDYLVKPFAASELLARVQAHVALSRLRQEARDALVAERDRLQAQVAARAQAEEGLRRSHEHLSLALTAARMVAWEWNPHADVVTTSENLPDIYGVARLDASTQGFPLVHPDDRARHEATVRTAAETAGGYASTFRIIRPDTDAVVWLEERGVAVHDETGALQKLIGIAADVSAHMQAEAELRRQAALLGLAHDAIIVRDPRGTILTWNDGAASLYGWTATEAVGQSIHALLQTRVLSSGGAGAETDAALAAEGAWEGELEHTRRDGTRVIVESRQALLRAADGTPEAILEVNRDIAPRLELAAALARLQTLQDIGDAALSQLELPALLRRVLVHITAALRVDNTAILLLDETEQSLIVHHALGPEEVQTGRLRVPMGQGVAGRIAATRQPLILADLGAAEPVNPLLREQMASLMGVPLLVEDRLLGVMHVDSATPRRFTEDDLHLLQLVADRVALALDRARLYREALEARDLVTRLQRVTAALSATMTVDGVADVIIEHGLEALEAATGAVALLADDGASFTTVRATGYAPEVVTSWSGFPAADAIPIADAVRTRAPVILESRAEHNARYPHLVGIRTADTDGALVAIPLLLGDHAVGGLGLGFPTTRHFSAEERAMMGALGELCAQALERARLYEVEQQARAAAEAERRRLEQILDTLPVGVVIVDARGRVEVLNQAGRDIVGHDTRGEPLPSPGEEDRVEYRVRRPGGTPYPPSEVPLWRSLLHGEEIRDDQQLHRHAVTGHETPLLVNSAPLRTPAGTIVGAVAVFQDITALHEMEQAREEFLSSAAHDLKTPLTGIRGQAQLAQRRLARLDVVDTAPVAEQLTRILQGTDAMLALINELVDVTRLQMGAGLELHRQPTDLVALVRDCIAAQQGAGALPIVLEAAAPALMALGDAPRLARVVGNLLSNALKYSPNGGTIRVRVGREDGAAVLAVQDEGIGIPAEDLPHIFERFARAGNVAGHIQGTGIGLASAQGIVEQHGGTIVVQSVEGHGATFTVRLPLEPA